MSERARCIAPSPSGVARRSPFNTQRSHFMRNRSVLIIVGSLLGLAACSEDVVTSTPYYYYDSYLWPVTDYGYADSALWYDGYYDPFIGYVPVAAPRPGLANAAGAQPDGGQTKPIARP